MKFLAGIGLLSLLTSGGGRVWANDLTASFEEANREYAQGKFADAAATYEKLTHQGKLSASLYYNLGNALFKTGQIGRAILNYRRAEGLAPRDPDIKANLRFARESVNGAGAGAMDRWRARLHQLTLNEWTLLGATSIWVWLALLTTSQLRPELGRALRAYTFIAGTVCALICLCLGVRVEEDSRGQAAVVVAHESSVHYGPVEASPRHFVVHDGVELIVVDRDRDWLQVIDSTKGSGWLPAKDVVLISPG